MVRSRVVRIGGLALLVGGTLWVVALGGAQLRPSELVGLVAVPSLCLLLGLTAVALRRVTHPGAISNVGFTAALLGSVLLAYGSTGTLVFEGEVGGIGFGPFLFTGVAFGALMLGLGTAVIAASMIVADILPRLSPIPLLAGAAGVGITGGFGLVQQLQRGPERDVFPLEALPLTALWALFGLGWVWLGYLLYSERTRPSAAAADPAWAPIPMPSERPRAATDPDDQPLRA